jgi:hypothetical protein
MLPYTCVGANVDIIIPMIAKQLGYVDLINQAATVVDGVNENAEAEKYAHAAARSDVFSPGLRYVSSHLDSSRIQASRRAIQQLKNKGLDYSRYAYEKSPRASMDKAVEGSAVWKNEILTGRKSIVEALSRNADKPVGDKLAGMLKIFPSLDFEFFGVAPLKYAHDVIVGPDKRISRVINCLGVGAHAGHKRLFSVIAKLMNDIEFPRIYTAETIIDILTRPKLLNDMDATVQVLIVMGAKEQDAKNVAQEMSDLRKELALSTASLYSVRDTMLLMMNMSYSNVRRVVEFQETGYDAIDMYLQDIGALMFVTQPNTILRKVRITYDGDEVDAAYAHLLNLTDVDMPSIYSKKERDSVFSIL